MSSPDLGLPTSTPNDSSPPFASKQALRRQVEQSIAGRITQFMDDVESMKTEQLGEVLRELQVRHIELQLQNEELCRTELEVEAQRARYFAFYENAPNGYCTISEKGIVLEANAPAFAQFGLERGKVVSQPFSQFILSDDLDEFNIYCKQVFNPAPHNPVTCVW